MRNPGIWNNQTLMKPDIFRTLVYSEPWHMLKPWYIQDLVNYKRRSIFRTLNTAYLDSWYIQNLSIFITQGIQYCESLKYSLHRTIDIFTTLVYLSPNILKAYGILRNLPNMYGGLFSTKPWVTLVYLELRAYPEPCQICMKENFIHNLM